MKTLFLLISLTFSGCSFLEVQVDVTQRAIMDKGDNTKDSYSKSGDNKAVEDKTTTVIKTIP